jgi:UDP-glucose 4-epimerase
LFDGSSTPRLELRYGTHAHLPVDETNQVDLLSPHAVGKLAGEMYLRAYAEMYCLAPICLALANMYGPRQSPHGAAGVIAVLGLAMITGGPSAVYRDGADAYDYVYVDDVVDAFVRAGAPTSTAATNAPRRSAGPRPPRSYSAKSNVNQSTTHDTSNYSTNSYFYSDRC